jgi:hypothetical protein
MKTKTLLFFGILILLSACRNVSPEKEYLASLGQLTPEEIMSGRKTQLLYGNVSKVTYPDGCFTEFNEDGNIVKRKDRPDDRVQEYRYISPQRYQIGKDRYHIIYTDSMRIEEWDSPEKLNTHYMFDANGRVTAKGIHDYYSYSEAYHYRKNELLPFKTVITVGDENGQTETSSLYTYTQTDARGNWLKCKVVSTIRDEQSDYDSGEEAPSVSERTERTELSRSIEYFPGEEEEPGQSEEPAAFKWPPRKYPCNIPFKVLKKNDREIFWEIESITCTGRAKDRSGYTFTVRGTGTTDSRKYSMGSRTLSFAPEERNSTTIKSSQQAAYIFPGVDAGAPFEMKMKGLFPGYYDEDLFVGFLIFKP